jgi:hypothetical protein
MKTPRYSFDEENHDELTADPEGEWCLARDVRKLEAELTQVKADLKSTIESSNEMSDSNGELTAELLALREKVAIEKRHAIEDSLSVEEAVAKAGLPMGDDYGRFPIEDVIEQIIKQRDELREKYSTVCSECGGSGMAEEHNCPYCHGTRKVMILDAEGVKKAAGIPIQSIEWNLGWHAGIMTILEGKQGGSK